MSRSPSSPSPKSDTNTVMLDFRYTAVRQGHKALAKVRTPEISIVAENGVASLSLYPGINFVDAELLRVHSAQKGWKYANSVHKLAALPDPDVLADIIDRSCSRPGLVQLRGMIERSEFGTEAARTALLEAIEQRLALNLFEAPQVPYVAPPAVTAAMNAGAPA